MSNSALKIGYVMQADSVDMSVLSGPQLHVKAVIEALQARGHAVRLLAIQQGETQWTDDLAVWHSAEYKTSNKRLFRLFESAIRGVQSRLKLPFFRWFDSVRFADAGRQALAECDIIYERYGVMSYGGQLTARKLKIPHVLEVNGDLLKELQQLEMPFSSSQWRIIYWLSRRIFRRAAHTVTVSHPLRHTIHERWKLDERRVTAVENGADVARFATPKISAEKIRTTYKLKRAPSIIFVGGFQPWHNLEYLIDAFVLVNRQHPKAQLVLVGDGPMREKIEQQVAAAGLQEQVVFTGNVAHDDVAALLNSAEIAVLLPSDRGTSAVQSPLKLFEYMAANCAIVASSTQNILRILTHRKSGLLVPPNDSLATADAISELLNDEALRDKLSQNAQQQALEKHSWAQTVQQLERIFYTQIGVTAEVVVSAESTTPQLVTPANQTTLP